MKYEHGFIGVLLLLFIVIVTIGGLFYYGVINGNLLKPETGPTTTQVFDKDINSQAWESFENKNEKYVIKYSKDWTVESKIENGVDSTDLWYKKLIPEQRVLVVIRTRPETYNSLDDFKKWLETNASDTIKGPLIYQQYILNQYKGYRFMNFNGLYFFLYNPSTHKVQEFITSYEHNIDSIDQILSTFTFLTD